MKALQKRNKKNRTADYEGLTEDRTSERYQDIKVIGYIELGRGFKENKDTDILEIPTGRQDDDGEEIIQKFNMFTGKAAGKIVGYIKVDEDKYVGIIEHHLYPFVISGIATATIICTVVTSDIRPVEVNTATGDVEISDTMDKLQRDIQEIEKAETLYLWVPAFSSELKLDADNPYVPLRNFSENQFRDEMWTEADKLREEVAENPDKHDKEEMRKKFSITYLTLTATEINNCIDYVYGLTDEKLRETYENEFSFQYDILVDKETAKKMHISDIDSSIVEKYRNSEEVVVYSTYPELLPPGTQYDWNAFWAFTEPGRYKVTLKVIPYLTETLEAGSPRNVTVDIVISK